MPCLYNRRYWLDGCGAVLATPWAKYESTTLALVQAGGLPAAGQVPDKTNVGLAPTPVAVPTVVPVPQSIPVGAVPPNR